MTAAARIVPPDSATLPRAAVIGDRLVPAASGAVLDNVNPATGQVIGTIPACDAGDVDRAVVAARTAFEAGVWRDLTPRERKGRMLALADTLAARAEEFAVLETLDTGKPIRDTRTVDIPLALGTLRYYAEAVDKIYGEVGPSGPGKMSWAVHDPLGVIGAIVPWNFPLHMAMWKIAPALAMGNSIVVKPSELSSLTALRLGEIALASGIPAGVLNVVTGTGEAAGAALAQHGDVDMIAFTGSGPVGRKLMHYAADSNLKRVSLELGGKSPHIVFADCPDFDRAAREVAWGIFYNQGQVCTAGSRLLVERSVHAEFVERVLAVAATIRPGDPLDPATQLGALISEKQLAGVMARIERASADGADLRLGGRRVLAETGGSFLAPTVFDAVSPAANLAREEVFGPVLGIIPFDNEGEALALANGTEFGLASGLWTRSIDRAHRFARLLKAGMVWVNGWDACDITMPFGGFKQSGFGRDRSLHALYKYADMKAITVTFA